MSGWYDPRLQRYSDSQNILPYQEDTRAPPAGVGLQIVQQIGLHSELSLSPEQASCTGIPQDRPVGTLAPCGQESELLGWGRCQGEEGELPVTSGGLGDDE